MLDRPVRNCECNATDPYNLDPRVLEPAAHRPQVLGLGFGSFTVNVEAPLGLGDMLPTFERSGCSSLGQVQAD